MLSKLKLALLISGSGILFWTNVVMRFKHPEWTEFQAFLNQWPEITVGVILVLLALFINERSET